MATILLKVQRVLGRVLRANTKLQVLLKAPREGEIGRSYKYSTQYKTTNIKQMKKSQQEQSIPQTSQLPKQVLIIDSILEVKNVGSLKSFWQRKPENFRVDLLNPN